MKEQPRISPSPCISRQRRIFYGGREWGAEERVAERGAEGVENDVLDLGDARAEGPLQGFDQQGAEEAERDDRAAQGRQRGKAEAERHEARDVPDEEDLPDEERPAEVVEDETEINEYGMSVIKYPELEENQVDVIYLSGEDMYLDFID